MTMRRERHPAFEPALAFRHKMTLASGVFAAIFSLVLGLILAPSVGCAAPYRLGAEDKLKIKVYEWRPGSSNAYEWTALTGEFTVAASGDLSLPLIGEVSASGKTPSEMASTIAELLQQKIGLSKKPDASVEISEYRPFYVLGLVTKPGEYPYRPDLTVLQAISSAGGIVRLSDIGLLSYERETLVSRGDLRVLNTDATGLTARRARLEAELQLDDAIQFPAELGNSKNNPDMARIMREETLLFTARKDGLKSQTDALQQTKTLLAGEVEALKSKSVTLQRQYDLAAKELASITSLVAKGLAISSRQLGLEQNVAQFESSRLDVNLLILRAQQDISKAERDILDLKNRRRNEILTELAEVRTKLAVIREKTETAQAMIYNSEVKAPQAAMTLFGSPEQRLTYTISRNNHGQIQTLNVTEAEFVEPGDVVRIERPSNTNPAIGAANAPMPLSR